MKPMHRLSILVSSCALLLATAWLAGCSGRDGRLERTPGSALWIDPAVGSVDAETLASLRAAGVDEVFLERAALSWDDGTPQLETRSGDVPDLRAPATLVVTGEAPPPETDLETAAEHAAAELRRLLRGVQGSGLVPQGLHWDLDVTAEGLTSLATWLAELRSHLDASTFQSATLPRDLLEAPGAAELARRADFLVTFLYGQRPEEPGDDLRAWDFEDVAADLERLDALGQEYLLGVSTVGRLVVSGSEGGQVSTRVDLADLVTSPAFEDRLGMSLEGIDRRIYDYRTTRAVGLGELDLPSGSVVRLSFLSAHDVHRLLDRVDELALEHHRGQVYLRPPAPEEGLSLRPEVLARALSGNAPRPRPQVRLKPSGRGMAVTLTNAGAVDTEVGRLETNYVELRLDRGSFAQVAPGEFARYDLLDSETGRRSLRSPDVLRLYTPYLAPGATVASGPIRLSGARIEEVSVAGEFLAPGGRTVPVVAAVEDSPSHPGSR